MQNPIRISEHSGKWIVRFVEGGVTSERAFDFEMHATSWASDQLMRLGLSSVFGDEPEESGKD